MGNTCKTDEQVHQSSLAGSRILNAKPVNNMPLSLYAYQVVQPELNRNVEMALNDPSTFFFTQNYIQIKNWTSRTNLSSTFRQSVLTTKAISTTTSSPMASESPSSKTTLTTKESLKTERPTTTRPSSSFQTADTTKAKSRIRQ
jgi:hypothetical protein